MKFRLDYWEPEQYLEIGKEYRHEKYGYIIKVTDIRKTDDIEYPNDGMIDYKITFYNNLLLDNGRMRINYFEERFINTPVIPYN